MRTRDEQKREAIIQSTLKLVNENGFVHTSVSKIAKDANVSPATLYIYYKNKEDLIISTYTDIKIKLADYIFRGFDSSNPIKETIRLIMKNTFDFIQENPTFFYFKLQFENSHYKEIFNDEEIQKLYGPIMKAIDDAIKNKEIKDVSLEVLSAFIFYPIFMIAGRQMRDNNKVDLVEIENVFLLAWDAIKV